MSAQSKFSGGLRRFSLRGGGPGLLAGLLIGTAGLRASSEILVLTTADAGPGSLRAAIQEANARPGRDRIRFQLPADAGAIKLTNALPAIADAVLIDGWSQPGATRNTLAAGTDAVVKVAIDGSAVPPGADGLVVRGLDSEVRGVAVYGFRANAAGGGGAGLVVDAVYGVRVRGCRIGVRPDGRAAPNATGLWLRGGLRHLVGGARPEDRNVIQANAGPGLRIEPVEEGGTARNEIRGNLISGNAGPGILVSGSSENTIAANAIQDNGGLGIELDGDGFLGPDPADMLDLDTGANAHQNFPILAAAVQEPGGLRVEGRLWSAPETRFTVELFASPEPDPSGYGEGAQPLGTFELVTDANGEAHFTESVPAALADTDFVTATATDDLGNTSEFSAAQVVTLALDTLPDAAVELASVPAPAPLGEEILLRVRAVDRSRPEGGFGDLTNRVVTLTLPPELTLLETPEAAVVAGTRITWTNVTIPAGGAAAFSARARTELPGHFPVEATVSDDGPSRGNNRVTLELEVLSTDEPRLRIADTTVREGDADAGMALLTVSLSAPATRRVTFDYATVPGEALPGEDYQAVSGVGGILPGGRTATLVVPLRGDEIPEPAETFSVRLTHVSGALVERNEAVVTIEDDDEVTLLSADLALRLGATPEPAAVNDLLTLTLAVTNRGPDDALAARVLLPLPETAELIGAEGGASVITNDGRVVFLLDPLAAGDEIGLTARLRPTAEGILTNRATVELLPPPAAMPAVVLTDPDPANNEATVFSTVRTALEPLAPLGNPAFNPQTGLFEQWVRFFNLAPDTWPAVRVYVTDLPEGVTVHNATGETDGAAYVQYNLPVAPGSDLLFLIEFFVPDRVPPDTPAYAAVPAAPEVPPDYSGPGVPTAPDRAPAILAGGLNEGRFLLEFRAVPGARYAVQYRDAQDAPWKSAVPALTATANVVQWLDDGPPKTDRPPEEVETRFYRVLQLQAAPDSEKP